VVISIISLLSSVVLASLNTTRAKARDAQRMSNITEINKAIQLYIFDNGGVAPYFNESINPSFVSDSNSLWDDFEILLSSYIPSLPVDPCPSCVNEGYLNNDENLGDYQTSTSLRYVYKPCTQELLELVNSCLQGSASYFLYPSGFETRDSSSWTGFNNGINY
jgi:type II secretory pathway pseudopilin PulG